MSLTSQANAEDLDKLENVGYWQHTISADYTARIGAEEVLLNPVHKVLS